MIKIQNHRTRHRASTLVTLIGSAALLLIIFFASSTLLLVQGRTALNPIAIGIRSAIARGPSRHLPPNVPSQLRSSFGRSGKKPRSLFSYGIDDLHQIHEAECLGVAVGRGGAAAVAPTDRRLHFWEAMICGAISRSVAQTIMHPANTMKTILQSSRMTPGTAPLTVRSFLQWENMRHLTRGAGAQLVLSIPNGAVNFAVLEFVRRQMNNVVSRSRYADVINRNFGPGMDFLSSALSTVCCSVVSTPQTMICDNIMAGTYPNLISAISGLMKDRGVSGFYTGWWPGIAGKIPSYVSFTS